MAKIDDIISSLEAGLENPEVRSGTTWIEDAQMEGLQVRRKGAGATHYRLWYLSVGETGQAPTATFWAHRLTDTLKKALLWKGLPTKNTRGPRKKDA